jgi:hypothetical protein
MQNIFLNDYSHGKDHEHNKGFLEYSYDPTKFFVNIFPNL